MTKRTETHVQIKQACDRVGRSVQKIIHEYLDVERGCYVKVLESKEVPFRSAPVYSEEE